MGNYLDSLKELQSDFRKILDRIRDDFRYTQEFNDIENGVSIYSSKEDFIQSARDEGRHKHEAIANTVNPSNFSKIDDDLLNKVELTLSNARSLIDLNSDIINSFQGKIGHAQFKMTLPKLSEALSQHASTISYTVSEYLSENKELNLKDDYERLSEMQSAVYRFQERNESIDRQRDK